MNIHKYVRNHTPLLMVAFLMMWLSQGCIFSPPLLDGNYACSRDTDCPEGMHCATDLGLCQKKPGQSTNEPCSAEGSTRECYTGPASARGVGSCKLGTQTCTNGKWMVCEGDVRPAALELCDGKDSDCDGEVDEGCPCKDGQTRPCFTGPKPARGVGICKDGTQTCFDEKWGACTGQIVPQPEVCDNQDNDCNGQVDEKILSKRCYTGPAPTLGIGTCKSGYSTCASGKWTQCRGEVTPQQETCDGQDDDCNGKIDDNCGKETCKAGEARACYNGPEGTLNQGACRAGKQLCSAAGTWGPCQGQVLPKQEDCDGVDNDCDGQTDEFDQPQTCYTGPTKTQGVGACKAGVKRCLKGLWTPCSGQVTPQTETCDKQDNDCDGQIDEDVCGDCQPGARRPCYTGPAQTRGKGVCKTGIQTCGADAKWGNCFNEVTPSKEICDGKDNDCDGEIDEGTTLCGANSLCNAGTCKRSCTGECPLGQTCKDIDGGRYCVGNTPCAQLEAQCKSEGKVCRNGRCVGVCEGIQCPAEHLCTNGKCIKDDCYNNPKKCIPGQYCKAGQCTANPCSGVQCSNQQQCKNGKCVGSCADVQCPAGQSCKDGTCQGDPCAGVQCPAGQACVAGTCAADPCLSVACQNGQTCTGGKCIDDPCAAVVCPAGQVCVRPQGDCFGRGPGQPTEGPPGDAGPSPEPVVTPDAPAQPDTPSTTPDTPSGDQGIVTKTPDQINYTPPESVTRPRGNTCVCNVDNPTEGFGMAAFFMLLFFGFFSLLRRKP
ncbi:MAG TPA: hypothetical protein DCE42_29795 [Myxococcales bacterium]|nr:hypothetical protein [Myxococcales bacterium]